MAWKKNISHLLGDANFSLQTQRQCQMEEIIYCMMCTISSPLAMHLSNVLRIFAFHANALLNCRRHSRAARNHFTHNFYEYSWVRAVAVITVNANLPIDWLWERLVFFFFNPKNFSLSPFISCCLSSKPAMQQSHSDQFIYLHEFTLRMQIDKVRAVIV